MDGICQTGRVLPVWLELASQPFEEVAAPRPVHEQSFWQADVTCVSTTGPGKIAGAQFLHLYGPRHWIDNVVKFEPMASTPADLPASVALLD